MPGRDPQRLRVSLRCQMPDGSHQLIEGEAWIPSYSMFEIDLAAPDAGIHEVAAAVLGYMSEVRVHRMTTVVERRDSGEQEHSGFTLEVWERKPRRKAATNRPANHLHGSVRMPPTNRLVRPMTREERIRQQDRQYLDHAGEIWMSDTAWLEADEGWSGTNDGSDIIESVERAGDWIRSDPVREVRGQYVCGNEWFSYTTAERDALIEMCRENGIDLLVPGGA